MKDYYGYKDSASKSTILHRPNIYFPVPATQDAFIISVSKSSHVAIPLDHSLIDDWSNAVFQKSPQIKDIIIRDILFDGYTLVEPIKAFLEICQDEVLAVIPELELVGDGSNMFEAVNELKLELVDLFTDLKDIPEENLGKKPRSWKKIICSLVNHDENTTI